MVHHNELWDIEDSLAERIADLEEQAKNHLVVIVRLVERVDAQQEVIKDLLSRLDAHRDLLKQI